MFNLRKLVFVAILLAIVVVSLGAYTRLTHAGLGCPDWPGCYGLIDVPETPEQIAAAEKAFPERPVEPQKAWNEMIHRYFAGSLGLLIAWIAFVSIKKREFGSPVKLPILLLIIVTFQAVLGMWTVTMKLMPIVVMAHLLGGFTTLCLLFLLYLRLNPYRIRSGDKAARKYKKYAGIGILILTIQIALGGWTSANYAALTCTELPICQDGWVERMTWGDSFDPIPPERETYEYGFLTHNERLTIHVFHRIGAIITALYLGWLALMVMRRSQTYFFKQSAGIVAGLLVIQVMLGASNVFYSLPLFIAVSHNVVAACLMMAMIGLTYSLMRKT
ncbi:COX15/CtaA family protein [Thalassotalea agarivorans]|uniref:Cytochrome c oxidase assembly protein subunit 15 n=1 Tax=Thalassotalea agarivorans TaxID=349064 RepID=A0A1I0HQN9_THASX|nr:COX15/CtaA family protein [Thalassotalea agarivorans]SET85592.1 cytochrome c oxidase assembly protein subunit 15 [Thalassotalea agarivorans]